MYKKELLKRIEALGQVVKVYENEGLIVPAVIFDRWNEYQNKFDKLTPRGDVNNCNKEDKRKTDTFKPRKVLITCKEYQAIELGLTEIEGTIGYGDLSKEELKRYEMCEKTLHNLLTKVNNYHISKRRS